MIAFPDTSRAGMGDGHEPVAELEAVSVWRSSGGLRRTVLDDVDLAISPGEHWAVIGPNGAGKTTLLRVLSARMLPSRGAVQILNGRIGRVALHDLRRRIGLVEPALGRSFYPGQRAIDVVLGGETGSVLLVEQPGASTIEAALALLRLVGVEPLALRLFAVCSEGERSRILLARALMPNAPLLVLDEPTGGLDLPGVSSSGARSRRPFASGHRSQPSPSRTISKSCPARRAMRCCCATGRWWLPDRWPRR